MRDPRDIYTHELPLHGAESCDSASSRSPAAEHSLRWAEKFGYSCLREIERHGVCGVRRMLYTAAIIVGIECDSYAGRYCYETMGEAIAALAAWDGRGDPPGGWIKYKDCATERLGPGCAPTRVEPAGIV